MYGAQQIVVGVAGGVAVYKATEVVRGLGRSGYSVHVVSTAAANNFVTPALWEALTGNPVYSEVFAPGAGVAHIEIARHAQAIVIVAATADLLAKLATGLAPDMLTNVVLASTAPLIIAPAMHWQMWQHPATQANVEILKKRGAVFIEPESGALACGDTGKGRLADPAKITSFVVDYLQQQKTSLVTSTLLSGKKILISAGGTREYIDPVRFIGNRSTGLMGLLLANSLAELGAAVTLLSAHTEAAMVELHPSINKVDVSSTADLYSGVEKLFGECDALIMAAAVADYRPKHLSDNKLKKTDDQSELTLELVQNPDVLATFAAQKHPGQLVVGFAAETGTDEQVLELGRKKAARKGADYILLNQVGFESGFGNVNTRLLALTPAGEISGSWVGDKATICPQVAQFLATILGDDSR